MSTEGELRASKADGSFPERSDPSWRRLLCSTLTLNDTAILRIPICCNRKGEEGRTEKLGTKACTSWQDTHKHRNPWTPIYSDHSMVKTSGYLILFPPAGLGSWPPESPPPPVPASSRQQISRRLADCPWSCRSRGRFPGIDRLCRGVTTGPGDNSGFWNSHSLKWISLSIWIIQTWSGAPG